MLLEKLQKEKTAREKRERKELRKHKRQEREERKARETSRHSRKKTLTEQSGTTSSFRTDSSLRSQHSHINVGAYGPNQSRSSLSSGSSDGSSTPHQSEAANKRKIQ